MVGAKYLLALLMLAIGTLITIVMSLVFGMINQNGFDDTLSIAFGTTVSAMILMTFLLPLIYKFGVEKGRLMLIILAASFFALVSLLSSVLSSATIATLPTWLAPMILVAGITGMYLSYRISCRIFQKKPL